MFSYNFQLVCMILKAKIDFLFRIERKKRQQLLLHSSEFNANEFTMTTKFSCNFTLSFCLSHSRPRSRVCICVFLPCISHTKNFVFFPFLFALKFSIPTFWATEFSLKNIVQQLWYKGINFFPHQKYIYLKIFYWLAVG